MKTWSLQDAKNHFSEVVNAARRAPQQVTKHGKRAVVVVDAEEFDRLSRKNSRSMAGETKDFVEHLLSMPFKEGFEAEHRGFAENASAAPGKRTFVEHLLAIPKDGTDEDLFPRERLRARRTKL